MQIYWVSSAYNLQEKEFNDRVVIAMSSVVERIQKIDQDSALVDPVKQITSNFYVANINDTLHPYLLEALLREEFSNSNLDEDFEYGIYDCFNDSIVFGGRVSFDEDLGEVTNEAVSIQKRFQKDGHYFGIYFPSKSNMIIGRMDFWVFSSFMILLVVIFFAYAIIIILRQKRLSEVKTDFINNMTHELKTPISTISISSEVLLKPDAASDPERLHRYASIIKSENQRLKTQVDKVLQIATLNPGKIEVKTENVDLHELIQQAASTLEMTMQPPSGAIDLRLEAAQYFVLGDRVHLTNIIYNLLDNAFKYCDRDPHIEISTRNEQGRVCMEIQDNGIGIAQKHIPMLFDKFFRVPTGNVHNVKGYGLGLFYVRSIVKAHKGKIEVKSSEGEGSTFIIQLPFNKEQNG